MQQNKTSRKKSTVAPTGRRVLALGIIVLCILSASAAALVIKHHRNQQATEASRKAASSTQTQTPSDTDKQGNSSPTPIAKGSTPSSTYTPPTQNNGITITPSTSGDKVVVSTQLDGYSDGTCKLTSTNNAKTNTQTADIIYAPSYSSCAGFVVPISDLGSGNWSITLDVISGGITTSKTVSYEVQ